METSALGQSASDRYRQVASPIHTILVLAVLQRQFMALTTSAPAGILLAAVAFGAAHAYQGLRIVILIGLYGAMFGILAHWRGSVRPGMIAYARQDSLNGVLAVVMKH